MKANASFLIPIKSITVNIEEGLTKGIPVYLIIFIFSLIFQVALAWDAVEYQPLIQQREKTHDLFIFRSIIRTPSK